MQSHEQRWYLKLYLQLEWICPLCAVDHAYHTQQALHNHLEESHSSDFPKSLFDGISRQSKVKRHRNWNECLLCSLEVKEDGGKSYGAGFKRQKSYLGSDVSKQAKTSLAMVNVGQHDSSKSNHDMNSDSNYDSDSNFNSDSDSHSKRKKDNSSRHEDRALVMGQHVWSHLQTIMLLTLRFDDLALDTGEVDGDCGNSNSVEADQIVESADSDSDKHSMSDMDVDMEEEQSGLGVDIFDDNDQNQDSTIPDCDSQPTFPMSYDNLTTDADEFMQGILESGAFQGGLSDLTHDAYTIAWFYATSCELKAALAVLDEEHQPLPRISGDSNEYVVGRIGRHNVVMTCLLQGYGEVNTAKVATDLTRSFPNIKATLVVGLGGGAPSEHVDLRLGDVVVGTAVVEYDLRKATNSRHFEAKRRPKIPAELLRAAVAVTKAQQLHHGQCSDRMMRILQTSFANTPYPHSPDRLFRPEYTHPDVVSGCVACDIAMLKPREARPSTAPWIHHGVIASGDSLIKNAAKRDDIAQRHDAICFEMEAAALMDNMQCLPIRGICDYSDSHKNKDWQNWAAATAASWARELLEVLSPFSIGHQVQSVPYNLPPPPYSQSSLAPGVFNRRKELLESLSFPKINTRRDAILQTQTCQWFLHLPKYKAWIENDRHSTSTGFLWLHGKAGAGKSTMMKFLEARARKSKLDTTVVSFFFHARGDTLQKSVEGLYRSLLYDTLKALPDLQSVLDDTATVPLTQQGCPDHDALKELLRSAIQRLGQRSLTFFIDALDECNEDDARDMVEFFRLLAEESIELRICFSSRPYPCIETEPDFVLEREAGHSEDLAKYVSENLKASKRLREDLQQQILVTAKGIFLWVVLVVKILNDEIRDGIPNPRQRLRKIPFELGDLFKEMLMRDQERPEELKLCILWVLLAKRPLNTVELRHAIWADGLESGRYEVDDDSLFEDADEQSSRIFAISTSKGLVEADDHKVARPALQFIHVSVRDFLIKERGIPQIWPELGVDWEANSHKMLMACCRAYLSHPVAGAVIDGEEAARRIISVSDDGEDDDVEQTAQDDDSNTDMKTSSDAAGCIFLGYASQHILHHANLACQSIDHEGFLAWFFSSCGYKALDYGQKFKSRRYGPTAEPLYMLADRGCARLIRASHGQYPAVYNKSLQFRHPLFAAMANNHEDTVAALLGLPNVFFEGRKLTEGLGRMADVSEFSGRTPLSWAAQEGRLSLMKILVKNGAHPKERDPGRRLPWQRAVTAGKIEAVDLLACLTVIVQLQDESLRHLMWEDVNRGDIRGAMCVLKHPDSRVARNALNEALESDWLQIMSSAGLLPAVQFVAAKSTTEQRGDALLTAAKLGHLKVVDFMLDSGAAIDFQNSPHGTAVATASSSGHADIVQFLISRKANISLEYDCETALTLSSSYGHEDVVRALVEAGADVNQQTKLGRTALMEASLRGRTSIVRLFLALGADPRLKDARNRTAYDEAVEPGEDDIAQMLRQSLEKW